MGKCPIFLCKIDMKKATPCHLPLSQKVGIARNPEGFVNLELGGEWDINTPFDPPPQLLPQLNKSRQGLGGSRGCTVRTI